MVATLLLRQQTFLAHGQAQGPWEARRFHFYRKLSPKSTAEVPSVAAAGGGCITLGFMSHFRPEEGPPSP